MITLNIFADRENKDKVTRSYTVDGYDLMLGTVEDFMAIIDIDKLNDNTEIAKMVIKGYDKIKSLLKDVFTELTDEDLRYIKVNDLVTTIVQLGTSVIESLNTLKAGN